LSLPRLALRCLLDVT